LKEVSRKYEKMVERGFGLDPVSFHDPQLEEASRCLPWALFERLIDDFFQLGGKAGIQTER
jgi:hypothetical protein